MIEFKIIKKSKRSRARIGILTTPHGEVETPAYVAVSTMAAIKTLESDQIKKTNCQILISNTHNLHLKLGEEVIEKSGGIHKFMNWDRPMMTDSGGFQVFSLGFGRDFGVGKILKYFPGVEKLSIDVGSVAQNLKIVHDGVYFKSPIDGKVIFMGPKESIQIQEKLGADIIFAFDECTAPLCTYQYAKAALSRTTRWADICLKVLSTKQALYGIVQGSRFQDLREQAARHINSLDFPGFAIGGDLGPDKTTMIKIINWVIPNLDENKPRHLLGIGYPEDIEEIFDSGIDTFDCTVPTHYARRGIAFTSQGKLNLKKVAYKKDLSKIDPQCECPTCQQYRKNYLHHLLRAREITALSLLTIHNLYYFNYLVKKVKQKVRKE